MILKEIDIIDIYRTIGTVACLMSLTEVEFSLELNRSVCVLECGVVSEGKPNHVHSNTSRREKRVA